MWFSGYGEPYFAGKVTLLFCTFVAVNGERRAKHKRPVNMKISRGAVERLMEEGFRGPVCKRPAYPQVRGCPSAEPWQRGLSAKEILLCPGSSTERTGRGGGNMPTEETSTKVKIIQHQTERLRQSRRSVFCQVYVNRI